jgi:chromosome segregation ATPase
MNITSISELRETNRALLEQLDKANAEVKRLTTALAAANADRDRLAQQLGMAQTEARGLRIELNRLGAPHAGYSYGDPLE